MKDVGLVCILLLLKTLSLAQTVPDIITKVKEQQKKLWRISYSVKRTDTIGTIIRNMDGRVTMERDERDSIFGFRFLGKKEKDPVEKMFNGRIGYAINHANNSYEIKYSPAGIEDLLNGGGGHLVVADILKLDTSGARAYNMQENDNAYHIRFYYPDLKEYDVTNRYKIVSIDKKSLMVVAVREHQESYGRVQDLYYAMAEIRNNEDTPGYDFFNPDFISTHQLHKPDRNIKTIHPLTGQTAPSIEFTDFDDRKVSSSAFEGKVVLLDFWEVWCAPCLQSMPKVKALSDKYRNKGLLVYGIVNDSSNLAGARQAVTKKGISFPMLVGNANIAAMFHVKSVPLYLVINRAGIIKYAGEGYSEAIEAVIIDALK